MSNAKKTAMIVAGACIAAGLLAVLAAMILIRFDVRRLNTVQFETKTYPVQESFRHIDIRDVDCDVRLLPSEDGQCRVVCTESDRIINTVEVRSDTLTITRRDTRRWYERISLWWGSGLTLTVYLPEQEYQTLFLKTVSGDISVPDDLAFAQAEISSTSGDISFLGRTTGGLTIQSTSGEIEAGNASGGDVRVTAVSGDVRLSDVAARALNVKTTSGEIELRSVVAEQGADVQSTSGDVEFDRFDAGSIQIKTVSGEVEGSLLSSKAFETHTTSGEVRVPLSDPSAGACSVTTTSGDIKIEVKP